VFNRVTPPTPVTLADVPTVLLLRHGRTTSNADGTLAGRTAVELDEAGQAQARAAGERLRGVPLRLVASSPLLRCRQTLDLALPGADVVIAEGLTECGYGEWEGASLKKLASPMLSTPGVSHARRRARGARSRSRNAVSRPARARSPPRAPSVSGECRHRPREGRALR